MNGLPRHFDPSPFVGRTLYGVAIARYQCTLHFDDDVSITVESDIAHVSEFGEQTAVYHHAIAAAALLCGLIECKIVDARAEGPGTLRLVLSNGEALEVYDSNANSESFVIRFGKKEYVI